MNSIHTRKNSLRKQLKQLRNEIPESSRLQKNLAIQQTLLSQTDILAANTVFCFISYGTEVHTHELIRQLLARGKQLAVPKILDSKYMKAIPFLSWDELEPGQLGILTPPANSAMTGTFDVVITPGLAFSESGSRLGFGRGYYDKWFQNNEVGTKIALAYELQIVDDLPVDEYDINVDYIITEERLIKVPKLTSI
jgi:5-formyltetrahydrofolate cyclo-ligase